MNRVFNKTYLSILSLALLCTNALAIEAEFKNSLIKVDLVKISESAYNIDLYTQNKFLEPVKIIKKSDLNYYILLPETKNNTTKTSSNGSEIRNITTALYPYAGQDVNNGYTKININTTKPLNFNVNVKNMAAASKITNSSVQTALATSNQATSPSKEEKVEKKNSVSSVSKKVETVKITPTKKAELKPKQEITKLAVKPVVKVDTPIKVEKAIEEEIKNSQQEVIEQAQVPQEVLVELDENKIIEEPSQEIIQEEEQKEIEQIAQGHKKTSLINKISKKLSSIGVSLIDLSLMLGAALITFIAVFTILSRKNEQARLRSKADLIDKEDLKDRKIQINTQEEPENNGRYFVFDKSIKQTGFCDPATSAIKRNYELSSYEPELQDRYERAQVGSYHPNKNKDVQNDGEYDIIQKILKEDSFMDISADDYEEVSQALTETPIIKSVAPASAPIKQQSTPEKKEIAEPTVLSSVEIAPERGFMCVSYNDNINLMGYIFDDVFALYNFKVPRLESYDIKFRLSEKDDKVAKFIVKVGNTKMLIKITKSSMNLEVLL